MQEKLENTFLFDNFLGGVEIEKDAGFSDFNRQREREATQRDVQKLKDSIQVG